MSNRRNFLIAGVAAAALACFSGAASAHALLDQASPGVGATVQGSPKELALSFTEKIVASFSGATLTSASGAIVPVGKAVVDPGSPATMHLSVGQALTPGTYVVNWHAVSVDTHHSSGSFKFTVAP